MTYRSGCSIWSATDTAPRGLTITLAWSILDFVGSLTKEVVAVATPTYSSYSSYSTPKRLDPPPEKLPVLDLEAVFRFANFAHGSQKDKSGLPYWTHLAAVWQNVINLGGDVELQAAAIMHDLVEDTEVTLLMLDGYFSQRIVNIVEVLTKPKGGVNTSYIDKIVEFGTDAMYVKLADLYHNTHPDRMASLPDYTQKRLKAKYYDAILKIETALGMTPTITQEQRDQAVKDNGGSVGSFSSHYGSGYYDYDKNKTPSAASTKASTEPWKPGKVDKDYVRSSATDTHESLKAKELKVGMVCLGYGEIVSLNRKQNGEHYITFNLRGSKMSLTCGEDRRFMAQNDGVGP